MHPISLARNASVTSLNQPPTAPKARPPVRPPLAVSALRQNGLLQPLPHIVRKLINLMAAIDLNRLPRRAQRNLAVLASSQMLFQVGPQRNSHFVIDQIVQLRQKLSAGHFPPPFFAFLRKYFANRSRNCSRALNRRDFTAGILKPKASAVSSVESPSTSRSTNTTLNPAGSP